jgi:predicted transcriptional regulator
LDELEVVILRCMEDKWSWIEDYTVSVREIARIFDRDPSNIRDTMKRMERKGKIKMVELRETPNGQREKRYAAKQFYEGYMADLEAEGVLRTSSA